MRAVAAGFWALALVCAVQLAHAGPPARDPAQVLSTACGWCHSKGGRVAGKGPLLMGTSLSDAQIVERINKGKQGAMPAYQGTFSDEDLKGLVAYIRGLKP